MAQYTIVTLPEQEEGLTYAFETSAVEGQTKDAFLQDKVSHQILNPMVVEQHNATVVALERSIATIPAANEEKASLEIQAVIVSNGGTLVPVGPPPTPTIVFVPPLT